MMKKPVFPVNAKAVWFLFHGISAAALCALIFFGHIPKVETNLQSIMPKTMDGDFYEADQLFVKRGSRSFIVMAEADTFAGARDAAASLYANLEGNAAFEEVSLYTGDFMDSIGSYIETYRYQLLDNDTIAELESGNAKNIADEALAHAYGAFSLVPLDQLDRDPFLLSARILNRFASAALAGGGNMAPRDSVLSANFEGKSYVMIRGVLSENGASLANRQSGVRFMYGAADTVLQNVRKTNAASNTRFLYSGIPFHSYESSSSAQKEIAFISTVTLILILVMFVVVFRSLFPVLMILFACAASVFSGTALVFLVFGEINILTFVFGVSLIGICVDYSVHFFMRRREGLSGIESRARIIRGVSLSFFSSLVAFCVLFFTPFTILKEFALFSAAGLFSSYLSALCLFPALPPGTRTRNAFLRREHTAGNAPKRWKRAPLLIALAFLVITPLLLLVHNRRNVTIKNTISRLYSMPPALMESEKIVSRLFNYSSFPSYVIIRGRSEEETLQREEAFAEAYGGGYLGISRFIPSRLKQRRSYNAAGALIPFAEIQFMSLGLPPLAAPYLDAFEARRNYFAAAEAELPETIQQLYRSLFIGAVEGAAGPVFYHCLMPLSPNAGDREALEKAASTFEWAALVDRAGDIDRELDSLTIVMFRLLAAAYAVIIAAVCLYYRFLKKPAGHYGWQRFAVDVLKIAAVPLILVSWGFAVLVCIGESLSFFSAVGIMLAFGLGLDYIFYLTEDSAPTKKSAAGAVILSFLTTALSFGALLASSFTPVYIFAAAVFPALSAAFCAAMLFKSAQVFWRPQ
ncbi:MAG: MMPL family transporter [Treponema sp.]|jgi:predicted exporter|nr:MMPL family transporter [Treponema sp.]